MKDELTTTPIVGTAEWESPTGPRKQALTRALLDEEVFTATPCRVGNAYPRQRNYHGSYFMHAVRAHVWHESLLERSVLRLLDHAGEVVAAASQPMRLRVSEWVHTPDFLVLHSDGSQTLIDVKPTSRIDVRAREQFEFTAAVCAHVGWSYRVLTESRPQVRVNLEYLVQFARDEYASSDVDAVVGEYRDGWTIGDLVSAFPGTSTTRARSWAMNALWNRNFVVDLDRRLTNDTLVALPTTRGLETIDAIQR